MLKFQIDKIDKFTSCIDFFLTILMSEYFTKFKMFSSLEYLFQKVLLKAVFENSNMHVYFNMFKAKQKFNETLQFTNLKTWL